jgi:FKBP-type peptidyl-prolyl cis-trans isomerase FklB
MPREAKFSPTFHEVSPEIVPPHSFCQIRFPIRWASAKEISTAACSDAVASIMMVRATATCRLDASTFFSSVPDFIPRRFWRFHFMKNLVIGITLATLAAPAFAQNPPALKDSKDKVSYSIGLDIGTTFKRQKMEINSDALVAGLKDGMNGAKPALSPDEVRQVMTEFSKDMREKTAAATKEAADKNSKESEKFLAENKAKPGVKTTASGLQYKVEKEGSGTPPKETDTVVVNYRGTLIDGTEFDSSYKRGEPATFPVNRVIKGWTEALQLMKPGAKYQLFIPPDLAYGPGGTGGDIGPNATLVFEVELISAKPGEASAPSPAAAAATSATASPKRSP